MEVLDKAITTADTFAKGIFDIDLSLARLSSRQAELYLSIAHILNLLVKKQASGTFSRKDLATLAQQTITALQDLKLWGKKEDADNADDHAVFVPIPLQDELTRMVSNAEGSADGAGEHGEGAATP